YGQLKWKDAKYTADYSPAVAKAVSKRFKNTTIASAPPAVQPAAAPVAAAPATEPRSGGKAPIVVRGLTDATTPTVISAGTPKAASTPSSARSVVPKSIASAVSIGAALAAVPMATPNTSSAPAVPLSTSKHGKRHSNDDAASAQ